MNLEAIALIEDDEISQRLCVTWPLVAERVQARAYGAQGVPIVPFAIVEAWAKFTGPDVLPHDVEHRVPVLFANGILLKDGTVAEEALQFIRGRLAESLPRRPSG